MFFVHPTVCLLQNWQTFEATFALDVSFLTAVVSGCSQGPVILQIIFISKISGGLIDHMQVMKFYFDATI